MLHAEITDRELSVAHKMSLTTLQAFLSNIIYFVDWPKFRTELFFVKLMPKA